MKCIDLFGMDTETEAYLSGGDSQESSTILEEGEEETTKRLLPTSVLVSLMLVTIVSPTVWAALILLLKVPMAPEFPPKALNRQSCCLL